MDVSGLLCFGAAVFILLAFLGRAIVETVREIIAGALVSVSRERKILYGLILLGIAGGLVGAVLDRA